MSVTNPWLRRACLVSFLCRVPVVQAQWQGNSGPSGAALGALVNSDVERYVRALTVAGIITALPWVARPFGAVDLKGVLSDTLVRAHPWQSGLRSALIPRARAVASVFLSGNSAFPWGANDGALWQGRGVNAALGVAAAFRWGPLTAVAAPVAFSAQNVSFPLAPIAGSSPYRNAVFPTAVDLPQRMGKQAYTRVAPGESSIRLQAVGAVVGVSTGSLGWGSGETFPSIFGANAGGFSHVFAGTTGRGVRIPGVARIAARYVLGVLEQTPWSPVEGSDSYVTDVEVGRRRVGSGLTVSITPAFLPTLELGASRFYHTPYRNGSSRWGSWSKPIEGIFKTSRPDVSAAGDQGALIDNQLAAFFARWTFPMRGIEAAFAMFRDDHNLDRRDFFQEPENNGASIVSLRAIAGRSEQRLGIVTFEYFNGDVSPIAQVRSQGSLYVHQPMAQGHTERGQLLGSPLGVGAISGSRLAYERFTADGALRASLQRWRTRSLRSQDPEQLYRPSNNVMDRTHDWILDAGVGATRHRGHQSVSVDAGVAWAGVWAFGDARTNWYARLGWSAF